MPVLLDLTAMELIPIRLRPPSPARAAAPSPGTVADILWATTVPTDRLEHIRARAGPEPQTIDLALFHRTGPVPATDLALGLCRRALRRSPSLSNWTAVIIDE